MADGSSDESSIVDSRACNKRKLDPARTARTEMKESWHDMSSDEEDLIEKLHNLLGDRWELISGRIPNRTAAEVEKYWTMKERKKYMQTKLFRPTCVRAHPRLKSGTAESSKGRKS